MAAAPSENAPVDRTTVILSKAVFDLETVKRAAYTFLKVASPEIKCDERSIACTLIFHSAQSPAQAEEMANNFRAEVLDQGLRRKIAEETEPTRNAILAYALSRTGLQDGE